MIIILIVNIIVIIISVIYTLLSKEIVYSEVFAFD